MMTVCIAFEGCICHVGPPVANDAQRIDGVVVHDALDSIRRLLETNTVAVVSPRPSEEVMKWFAQVAPDIGCELLGEKIFWQIPHILGITQQRIVAGVYIESNRGLRFCGWSETMYKLENRILSK